LLTCGKSSLAYNSAFKKTGYMVSCLASSNQMAQAISAPLIIPFMLFGGFFLSNDAGS